MPDLLVLRIHPSDPMKPTDFTNLLTGLTIRAYDLSFADSTSGAPLGTASGVANPHLSSTTNNHVTVGTTQIMQHYVDLPTVSGPKRYLESVATAVIVVTAPAGHTEYPTPTSYDLRFEIENASGQAIVDHRLDFNVTVSSPGSLSTSQKVYFGLPASTFLTLPATGAALDPGIAFVDLPSDGQPPTFASLLHAIDLVLADDPGSPGGTLVSRAPLTPAQSQYVANEIIWNRALYPLPQPDSSLGMDPFGALYTDPPAEQSLDSDDIMRARSRFEADQDGYYGTHQADALRLAGFVYSAGAAIAAETMSIKAEQARLEVPLITGAATATTVPSIDVALTEANGLTPAFVVPAAFFYALGATLPAAVKAEQRFDMARLALESKLLDELATAADAGVIALSETPLTMASTAITSDMAARRLHALGQIETTLTSIPLVAPVETLVLDWLNHAGPTATIVADFWTAEIAAHQPAYLQLLLEAITANFDPLIAAIQAAPLSVTTVADLVAVTDGQWRGLFLGPTPTADPPPRIHLLPPWTLPGTPEERVEAFIRHLRTFFAVDSAAAAGPAPSSAAPPSLPISIADVFTAFMNAYSAHSGGADFSFAGTPDPTAVAAAIAEALPDDPAAQAWLEAALTAIAALWDLTDVGSGTLHFSLMEALYSRGFTSATQIAALSAADFQYALSGSVAYPYAVPIYGRAHGSGGAGSAPPEAFNPVNPDGRLTDCVPPPELSPLGSIQYLHELLDVSAASTCAEPLQPSDPARLGVLLAGRRGPLGQLHATAANQHTPLPLIDLVLESLESLVTTTPGSVAGAVYDTATDEVAGHLLASVHDEEGGDPYRHDPQTLFRALPEHSTPATPVGSPAAYDTLRTDFSRPDLPYSQPLDVNRSYLSALRTSRFATMRHFRRDITEFAIDRANEPVGFAAHQWRYPVRLEIALEYLTISPEEYEYLYAHDLTDTMAAGQLAVWQAWGFDTSTPGGQSWSDVVCRVPEFLDRSGLTYCEFIDLWRGGYVPFRRRPTNRDDRETNPDHGFPECEPCCLDDLVIDFGDTDIADVLRRLIVFIRLWRTLGNRCDDPIDLPLLQDLADVLGLFIGGSINPDFPRQLASALMLHEIFDVPWRDADIDAPGTSTGADRTHLLSLWAGPTASHWSWALNALVDSIHRTADHREPRLTHQPELSRLIVDNLAPLSRLAGFDEASTTDSWHAHPTSTLRFAEILLKIYLSDFTVGEVLFLFSDTHLAGDDPFVLPTVNESSDDPLELPDDDERGLWSLRKRLLDSAAHESTQHSRGTLPSWTQITASLTDEFGYRPATVDDPLSALGEHFFPSVLEREGHAVPLTQRLFSTPLAAADTAPTMWNADPRLPFRYDAAAQSLTVALPLRDDAVNEQLSHLRNLNNDEQDAVHALYFAPRTLIAQFAFLFVDVDAAIERLLDADDDETRFELLANQFEQFHHRCDLVARHVAEHVTAAAPQHHGGISGAEVWRLLRDMHGDENTALTPWEDDSGAVPAVTWPGQPTGGAFAALLGLTGTGILGRFGTDAADPAWRGLWGPTEAFGDARNHWNAPVPTIIPFMGLTLTAEQLRFAAVRNGFALRDTDGEPLAGAQPFRVEWSGTLLIDEPGRYSFAAGHPTPEGTEPGREGCPDHRWLVTLRRGQKTWQLLNRDWPGEPGPDFVSGALGLRRGAYELTVRLMHTQPDFAAESDVQPRHTGFQLKYRGPDTDDELHTIARDKLYRPEAPSPLGDGLTLSAGAAAYLHARYTGSLRDIRRTYQRVFKAALLVHRFRLSARPLPGERQSELGYLLDHAQQFEGQTYYRTGPSSFAVHRAWFAPDLLPVSDPYRSPTAVEDARSAPSAQRQAALFDAWERLFDYAALRAETRVARERPAWRLFYDAAQHQSDDPAELVRHLGIDIDHTPQVLTYFTSSGPYSIASPDLESEAWAIRAWRAELWLDLREHCFHPAWIGSARPDRWAADDPGRQPDSGNENLTRFVLDGALENGVPRRYQDVADLDDGLRRRGRDALVSWLCTLDRVPLPYRPGVFANHPGDLSDLLLQDVQCGTDQFASRIEDAISAVHAFVQRARLGLEPTLTITPAFAALWDSSYATLRSWQCCTERALYRENWIEWDDVRRARRVEAFTFLERMLREATLTVAVPGGLEWWPGHRPPAHPSLTALQQARRSQLALLTPGPLPEGLDLLGTPDSNGQPSWLAPINRWPTDRPAEPDGGQHPDRVASDAAGADPTAPSHGTVDVVTNRARDVDEIADPVDDADSASRLPLWLQAAVRLGHRYIRVAAAGVPPGGAGFRPCPDPTHDTCCCHCGDHHGCVVDEYYFWLQDGEHYADIGQDADIGKTAADETSDWHRPDRLPSLLLQDAVPVVYLHWSRVRHGEFDPPRRSPIPVQIDPSMLAPGAHSQLRFVGRIGDSLTFQVSAGVTPTGYDATTPPGFRYDLATDSAVALPLVAAPAVVAPGGYPGGLDAYPYFAYACPGAPVEPLTSFSVALTVADALQSDCQFEAALKWYELVRSPLSQDNSWTECGRLPIPKSTDPAEPDTAGPTEALADPPHLARAMIDGRARDIPCCPTIAADDDRARERAVLLRYLETLVAWADALICQNTPEAFRRADVLLNTAARILGPCPMTVNAVGSAEPSMTVDDFVANPAALNPRLLSLYQQVQDRTHALLHTGSNGRRIRNGRPDIDMPYFGADPTASGRPEPDCGCGCGDECVCGCRPYRFSLLAEKAAELAAEARNFGASLLSAFEKGDAEYLATLRAAQERQLFELTVDIRQNELRDADWQVQALNKTKEGAQARLRYYQNLIATGLIGGEIGYESLTGVSMASRTAGNVSEAIAQGIGISPDFWIGVAGVMGTPLQFNQMPLGSKLAGGFATAARILNALADIATSNAGLSATLAGWDRREAEWRQQVDVITVEIQQIERQILGAERRRDVARRELDNVALQVANSTAVQNFLRDKFTSHELYLYLQRETAALYFEYFHLARRAARQAEHAFNYELGDTRRVFVQPASWDNLHEGLTAGDRLSLSVRQMQQAYLDANCREYELTKHLSMRTAFPMEFLKLQASGVAEIDIPEWMFDVDYPGHYLRRIRNVSLTIPCVVGPYTGVHCRLTLLSSRTRISPRLVEPAARCCDAQDAPDPCGCRHPGDNGYGQTAYDGRFSSAYAATEAIATSSGQNDAGLFELSFHDERYLPFEFAGAVSRWRIELPPETNFFDFGSLSDVVMHLNYTAREGGEVLARAASESARHRLPGNGLRLFDLRRDLPEAWSSLKGGDPASEPWSRHFDITLSAAMFPYVPLRLVGRIPSLQLLIEAPCADPGSVLTVRVYPHGHHCPGGCAGLRCDCNRIDVACTAGSDYPGLYRGEVDLREHGPLGPFDDRSMARLARVEVPDCAGEICDLYIVAEYCARRACGCEPDAECRCGCGCPGAGEQRGRR